MRERRKTRQQKESRAVLRAPGILGKGPAQCHHRELAEKRCFAVRQAALQRGMWPPLMLEGNDPRPNTCQGLPGRRQGWKVLEPSSRASSMMALNAMRSCKNRIVVCIISRTLDTSTTGRESPLQNEPQVAQMYSTKSERHLHLARTFPAAKCPGRLRSTAAERSTRPSHQPQDLYHLTKCSNRKMRWSAEVCTTPGAARQELLDSGSSAGARLRPASSSAHLEGVELP
jgi:hypothetical protein